MLTRRQWIKAALIASASLRGTALGAPLDSPPAGTVARIRGVRMALQSASFSFSGLGVPDIITTMKELGLQEIDIMSEHVEHLLGAPGIQLPGAGRPGPWTWANPPGTGARRSTGSGSASAPANRPPFRRMDPAVRDALRKWRLEIDLGKYRDVAARFEREGLKLFSYNLSFNDAFTDAEIEKGLLMANALGTRIVTASSPASVLPRVAPLAEKHDVIVAVHNHTEGPDFFQQAISISPSIWINLDVGHFFAMGHDPVAYLREHHARITNIHVKDRKRNRGREMPFGQGDTPLREVLTLVRDQQYDMPVCLEYVGPDGPAVELRRCLDYCRSILES